MAVNLAIIAKFINDKVVPQDWKSEDRPKKCYVEDNCIIGRFGSKTHEKRNKLICDLIKKAPKIKDEIHRAGIYVNFVRDGRFRIDNLQVLELLEIAAIEAGYTIPPAPPAPAPSTITFFNQAADSKQESKNDTESKQEVKEDSDKNSENQPGKKG